MTIREAINKLEEIARVQGDDELVKIVNECADDGDTLRDIVDIRSQIGYFPNLGYGELSPSRFPQTNPEIPLQVTTITGG